MATAQVTRGARVEVIVQGKRLKGTARYPTFIDKDTWAVEIDELGYHNIPTHRIRVL